MVEVQTEVQADRDAVVGYCVNCGQDIYRYESAAEVKIEFKEQQSIGYPTDMVHMRCIDDWQKENII